VYVTIIVGAMGTFSPIILETKGRSLEMDIIFDAVSAETRRQGIGRQRAAFERLGDGDVSPTSSNNVRV